MIKKSFTLIELLIVLMIIGILTTLTLPAYKSYVKKAKNAEAASMLSAFGDSVWRYYLEAGVFPTMNNTLNNPPPSGLDTTVPASTKYFYYGYTANTHTPLVAEDNIIVYAAQIDYMQQSVGSVVGQFVFYIWPSGTVDASYNPQRINTNWVRGYGNVTKGSGTSLSMGWSEH